jgi:hypothetical protein
MDRNVYFVLSHGQLKKAVALAEIQRENAGGLDQGDLNCIVFEGVLCPDYPEQVRVERVRSVYGNEGLRV